VGYTIMSKEETAKNEYIRFHYLTENSPDLLKELIQNPSEVLQRLGFKEDVLKCPEDVHKALDRAEEVKERVERLGNITLSEGLPKIAEIVSEVFGNDYRVSRIPFGIQFSEKVPNFDAIIPYWTATGTIGGTFGPLSQKIGVDGDG
jgi:hypothetical protein